MSDDNPFEGEPSLTMPGTEAEVPKVPMELLLPQDEMTPMGAVASEPPLMTEQPSIPPFPGTKTAAAPAPASNAALDIATVEADHAQWLTSEGKEGKRANFRGLDLSGMDISGRHLMEASFRGAILRGANLSGTDLRAADLSEAVLDNANLSGAFLYGASLARAQLHDVRADGADLTTANFTAAIAENINLTGAKMGGAILRDANFRHANFTRVSLRDANLRGATLVEANLGAADLSSADCRDVNFDRSQFAGAILDKTNFRGAKLGGVDMHTADFSVAQDVAAEAQAQSLLTERNKIQDEQAQLAKREKTLLQEKERVKDALSDMQQTQEKFAVSLRRLSRGFMVFFALWLIIALLVLALVIDRFSDIDISRVMIILSGVGVVFLLALFSMLLCFKAAGAIKKFAALRPPGLDSDEKDSVSAVSARPALMAEPPAFSRQKSTAPSLEAAPAAEPKNKPGGFGFGKKKLTN